MFHYFSEEANNFEVKLMHENDKIISILSNGLENFIVECIRDGATH